MGKIYLHIRIANYLEPVMEVPEPYKNGSIVEVDDLLEIKRIAYRLMDCFSTDCGGVDYSIHILDSNAIGLYLYECVD